MTLIELETNLRSLVNVTDDYPTEQLYKIVAFYVKQGQIATDTSNATEGTRGIDEVMKLLGTPEAMLAAFVLQLFARYSKDMVREIIKLYGELNDNSAGSQTLQETKKISV